MAYEYASHRKGTSRAGHIARGMARGGAVKHDDEKQDRKLINEVLNARSGESAVPGPKSRERFDQPRRGYARGGAVDYTGDPPERSEKKSISRGKGNVTVVVQAPAPAAANPTPMPVPIPPPPPPAIPAGPPPGAGAMPPPPGGGPGIGAGRPPIGPFKRGGRIPHVGEAKGATGKAYDKAHNKKGYSSGGRIGTYPKMTAGGDSGEGRLEKIEKYGAKARG